MNDRAREKLREIICDYGIDVCHDAKRVKGLLLDLCGDQRREINTLTITHSEGFVSKLLSAGNLRLDFTILNLAKQLQQCVPIDDEAALWAIESWALALNIIQQPVARTKSTTDEAVVAATNPLHLSDILVERRIRKAPGQDAGLKDLIQFRPSSPNKVKGPLLPAAKHHNAVGIDLGVRYSCIASLNELGQPVTIPNQEGELSTPSVVFFDGDQPIVGTEAMRNAIASPERVVQHAKRFMGNPEKFWKIDDTRYSPVHISGMILRKLIAAAQEQIGEISEAVITVPAQFGDAQRLATMQAGHAAGLERIEMINEPVAAALCLVLGNEGLSFTELAIDQQVLVYNLSEGTLDLAVVKYLTNQVCVVASDGDLELGGLDFTRVLVDAAAERFIADFGNDPRSHRGSLQFLSLEAEQAKRSLSVRPRAAITVQHERHRKTYQIEQAEFESLSRKLIQRSEEITRRILKDNKFGWAHIDVVLTTGGASRMPMIRESLKKLSGRVLNTSLSPDQSLAQGAAYYAGMLFSNDLQ